MPTILLVDDVPDNLGVLLDCLAAAGHAMRVADSGLFALQQVRHGPPDLILLDVMMPGIDGFETCRRLKADPAARDIPIIFMTALGDVVDKVAGFRAGAVDYITKPLHPDEVLARVSAHLQLRSLQAALEHKNTELEEQNERLDAAVQQRIATEAALATALDRAVFVVTPLGKIVFCSENARALLQRYFPVDTASGHVSAELLQGAAGSLHAEAAISAVGGCRLYTLKEVTEAPTAQNLESLGLTTREAEVLFWIAQGKTSPEISIILGMATTTVKKHVQNLMAKLGVETRLAAALKAMEWLEK